MLPAKQYGQKEKMELERDGEGTKEEKGSGEDFMHDKTGPYLIEVTYHRPGTVLSHHPWMYQ